MSSANFNQPPRRSLVTFTQKKTSASESSAGNFQAQAMQPETSAASSSSHGSSNVRAKPVFGTNTVQYRQQRQQQNLYAYNEPGCSGSSYQERESHSSVFPQHRAPPSDQNIYSSDSLRNAVMPLIGSSAVVSAPPPAAARDKRSATHFSTASGSTDEIVDSSSSSAVSDAANAGATATRARSGRQVKRPKFADEVVHTEPSFARMSGPVGTSNGEKRAGASMQGVEQKGMNKTRKSSDATSHSKKARQLEYGSIGDSPAPSTPYDEFGNAISPASPATSSTPSLSANPVGGNPPILTHEPAHVLHAEDTRLLPNTVSKPRVFSTSQVPSTSPAIMQQPYSAGTGAAPPKVSSVHQPVLIRSSDNRAAALTSPLPDDDVFSPPPRHSLLNRQDEMNFHSSLPMRTQLEHLGRGSAEPQQFVVLKPPENNSGTNRSGATSFGYDKFRPSGSSGGYHPDDGTENNEAAENMLNKTMKRKYVRKVRRPELELDEALAASSFNNGSGFQDVSFSHSTNDIDAGTEASGSVMTGTGTGKKRGGAGGNQPRRSSKTPSGRHNTPGSSGAGAGGSNKKKSAGKTSAKTGSDALVAGASSVHPSRKLTKQQAQSAIPCMKELVLLKQQRDELLRLITVNKDDMRPNTLKKIQKLIAKLGELAEYTVGAWKPIDDLRLIHGVEQLNDLSAVQQLIKFSCHFSLVDVQERWNALLHNESIAKLSFQAIQELPVTQLLLVQRERYMTPIEMEMLRRIVPGDKPYAVEFFDRVLAENKEVFLACRTGHDLMREWQTLQKLGKLPPASDDAAAHVPAPGDVPIYQLERQATNDALGQLHGDCGPTCRAAVAGTEPIDSDRPSVDPTNGSPSKSGSSSNPLFLQNKGAVHDMMERATMRMKHRIRTLEFELPRLKVLLEYMTGVQTSSFDPDFPEMCLAVMRGKMARFLIMRPEVNFGRSCPGFEPDVNLSYEGPATKISRHHGRIVLDISGRFAITNEGNRPFLVDDLAVLRGEYCFLNDYSIVEICGLTLVFYINKVEVAKQLKKRVRKDHDDLMSAVMAAHGSGGDVAAAQDGAQQQRSQRQQGETSNEVSSANPLNDADVVDGSTNAGGNANMPPISNVNSTLAPRSTAGQ